MSTPALPPPPKNTHWAKGPHDGGGLHKWLGLIPPALNDLESRSGTSVAGTVATFADLPPGPNDGQSWIVREREGHPVPHPAIYTWSETAGAWSDPVSVTGAATSAAVAAAVPTATVDTALAARVTTTSSHLRAALDATYAQPARPSDKTLYVSTNGNDSRPGTSWGRALRTIAAAVEALDGTPGTIEIGAGAFIVNNVILHSNISFRGRGQSATFLYTQQDMFPIEGAIHHLNFEHLRLGVYPSAGHVFNAATGNSGIYQSSFFHTGWLLEPNRVRGASGFAGVIRAAPGAGGSTPMPPPPPATRTETYDLGPHSLWTQSGTRVEWGTRTQDVQAGRVNPSLLLDTLILIPPTGRAAIAAAEELVAGRVRLTASQTPRAPIRPSVGTVQSDNISGTTKPPVRNIHPGSRTYSAQEPSGWTDLNPATLAALMAGDPGLIITYPSNSVPVGRFHGPGASGALRPQIELTLRSRT